MRYSTTSLLDLNNKHEFIYGAVADQRWQFKIRQRQFHLNITQHVHFTPFSDQKYFSSCSSTTYNHMHTNICLSPVRSSCLWYKTIRSNSDHSLNSRIPSRTSSVSRLNENLMRHLPSPEDGSSKSTPGVMATSASSKMR